MYRCDDIVGLFSNLWFITFVVRRHASSLPLIGKPTVSFIYPEARKR